MKTKEHIGPRPTHLSANEHFNRLMALSAECKSVDVFEFEGLYFAGTTIGTIKTYLYEDPAKSFFCWLLDNGLEVKQIPTLPEGSNLAVPKL